MFSFDTTITICNSLYNPTTGFDDYFLTFAHNCSWHSENKAVSTGSGISYDKIFKVRIVEGISTTSKSYVLPEGYTEPTYQFTLCPSVIVVKGALEAPPQNGQEYANLLKTHSEAFQVLSVHDNRRIWPKHFYVEGK